MAPLLRPRAHRLFDEGDLLTAMVTFFGKRFDFAAVRMVVVCKLCDVSQNAVLRLLLSQLRQKKLGRETLDEAAESAYQIHSKDLN